MAPVLEAPTLTGSHVRLEPLSTDRVDELIAASSEERSTYGWTSVPDGPEAVRTYVGMMMEAARAGEWISFAQVRVADDRAVGATNYLELRRFPGIDVPYAVEIGGTWLARSAQRSGINVEAKLLLLTYAFTEWGVGRVDFKTDARNVRSRNAILALGAQIEGVLRHAQPSRVAGEEGQLRDSALFSIIATEWPQVRDGLQGRLARAGGRA